MSLADLGIDMAKKKFDCCLLMNQKAKHKVFENNPKGYAELSAWLVKQAVSKVHACMEATGIYGDELAAFLYNAGHTVSMVNPARIKGFAQSMASRNKTDKVDATIIAHFCQALVPSPWKPIDPEVKELRFLVRRLEALSDMLNQETNRLEAAGSPVTAKQIQAHIEYLKNDIKQTRQLIKEHIRRHPNLKAQRDLLETIPGIGKATSAVLLAEISSLEDFRNARKLAAFAGLSPKQHVSGSSVKGKTRLCKTGRANLRKALYFPAIVAMQHNPIVANLSHRLKSSGKLPMVIIGAAMRKLIHIVFGVLKSAKPFNPAYAYSQVN